MPRYPGGAVRRGDPRTTIVTRVQARLVELGYGIDVDGAFGAETDSAVRLFQTRAGFEADGIVGPVSWALLFADPAPVVDAAPTALLARVVLVAATQVGKREQGGTNRGPEVDAYVRAAGLDPAGGHPWCQAFVYWCFAEAARAEGVQNPCVKTARVMEHWARSPVATRVAASTALDHPGRVVPGSVLVIDHGHGFGHTGLVERVDNGMLHTIEGNTNETGGREGYAVMRKRRSIASINTGFVVYP